MPKFLIVICLYRIFATVTVLRALVGCPGVSKSNTLNSCIISVVFFSCFVKFKCLGDVLDSVTPITACHIEVPSFGRFYNLAQIWSSTASSCSVKTVKCCQIFFLASRQLRKNAQHNCIGQFKTNLNLPKLGRAYITKINQVHILFVLCWNTSIDNINQVRVHTCFI